MDGSYGHLVVLGSNGPAVISALDDEPAYVATFDSAIAIFSQSSASDAQMAALLLSERIDGDVLGFMVVDDDVLGCILCRDNEIVAEVTVPTVEDYAGISTDELELMAEYLDEDIPNSGSPNDAKGFVFGAGIGDARVALEILNGGWRAGEQVLASQRQNALLDAFGLPTAIVGWDYYQFDAGIDGFEGPTPLHVAH